MKKTLVLTENFPPLSGGSGRWFWELYSRLPKEQYLIVADNLSEAVEFDKSHDLNIIRMPLKSKEWGFKSLQGLKFYAKCFWQLRKIIKQHQITYIHTGRVIHEGVTAWLLKLFTGVKYLTFVHGEDVETAAISREHDLMVKQVCKHADRIVCNSHNSANIVKRLGYADDSKITVLHPGFDSIKFIPASEDTDFKEEVNWQNKVVILTVGRLQQRKGQDKMIEAMSHIVKNNPDVFYAVIGNGECKPDLIALIKKYNLQDNVQLMDHVTDEQMIKCYQQCDIFILPNRTIENDIEGFGMVLVEAQACGKVVIAGDSGGTKETMLIDESGFVIDCTSAENIAEQLQPLLADKSKRVQMGQKGIEHVNQNFTWLGHVEKAKQLFDS